MEKISTFKNFKTTHRELTIEEIFNIIKSDEFKEKVSQVRQLYKNGKVEEANNLKKTIEAFTVSASFNRNRDLKDIKSYTQLLILDFDNIEDDWALNSAMYSAYYDPHTHLMFTSPKGKGLKIVVKIDSKKDNHKLSFQQVSEYYSKLLNLPFDSSGSDVTRLCFFSHDPSAYYYEESQVFRINSDQSNKNEVIEKCELSFDDMFNTLQPSKDFNSLIEYCDTVIKEHNVFKDGGRNNYIVKLSGMLNRYGVPHTEALDFILSKYNYNESEIKCCVGGIYERYKEQFGTCTSDFSKIEQTCFFPDEIFELMPDLVRETCKKFYVKRERDVFLSGLLSVLSACFPNVSGVYADRIVCSNLYLLVVALPGSGKGVLIFAKELINLYHKDIENLSRDEMNQHSKKVKAFGFEGDETPPAYKIFLLPCNASSAATFDRMKDNDGVGLFFDTEVSTIIGSFKQEWGSFRDILLKAYQHESIGINRKKMIHNIEDPKISMAVSGTPDQVIPFFGSTSDGLFSRFLLYTYQVKPEWKNVSENDKSFIQFFKDKAVEVNKIIEAVKNLGDIHYQLTEDQAVKFHIYMSSLMDNIQNQTEITLIYRHGLMAFRFTMLLSILRSYNILTKGEVLYCHDIDFNISLKLIEVFLQHSKTVVKKLEPPKTIKNLSLNNLLDLLPDEFQRKDAIALTIKMNKSERSIDELLKNGVTNGLLDCLKQGFYKKK